MASSSCRRILKTPDWPSPSASRSQGGFSQRRGAGIPGKQIEVGFDACLGIRKFLRDRIQRVGATGREGRSQVGCRQVAAGDDIAEQLDGPRGLCRLVLRQVGGTENGVDSRLRIHHRRVRGGHETRLRLAQGIVLPLTQRDCVKPLLRRGVQALDGVVDTVDGFAEGCGHHLVGAEFDDLAELSERDLLGLLHFLGALVQRRLGARGQQQRSLAGETGTLPRQLQAGSQTWNVPSAQIHHRAAEMAEHHAGADADGDGHAGDHGEGCEQTAPDAPLQAQQTRLPGFTKGGGSCRHAFCPAFVFIPRMKPRPVSRYTVNKIAKIPRNDTILRAGSKKAGACVSVWPDLPGRGARPHVGPVHGADLERHLNKMPSPAKSAACHA